MPPGRCNCGHPGLEQHTERVGGKTFRGAYRLGRAAIYRLLPLRAGFVCLALLRQSLAKSMNARNAGGDWRRLG
jgi:hypothetical protein